MSEGRTKSSLITGTAVCSAGALALLAATGFRGVADTSPSSASGRRTAQIEVNHRTVTIARTTDGTTFFNLAGSTDVMLVHRADVTSLSDNEVIERTHYRSVRAAWHQMRLRYGLTRAQVRRAIAQRAHVRVPQLFRMTSVHPSKFLTEKWSYGADTAAFRTASPLPVVTAGKSLLGLRLVEQEIFTAQDPDLGVSGPVLAVIYSEDPTLSNETARRLVLNLADPNGSWGQIYERSLSSPERGTDLGDTDARIVNLHQLAVRFRGQLLNITANWTPSSDEWKLILDRLQ